MTLTCWCFFSMAMEWFFCMVLCGWLFTFFAFFCCVLCGRIGIRYAKEDLYRGNSTNAPNNVWVRSKKGRWRKWLVGHCWGEFVSVEAAGTSNQLKIESKSDPYHAKVTSVSLSQRKRKVLSCTAVSLNPVRQTHNTACTYFYDVFNSSNIVAYDGSNRNTS